MHGRSSRRSRFHRRGGESRASRVPASPVSRCVLPLLGIVIGDKFSTACPADIDFFAGVKACIQITPITAHRSVHFRATRNKLSSRGENTRRKRALGYRASILYTFPRASSRNQWPEPLMNPAEDGNYLSTSVASYK